MHTSLSVADCLERLHAAVDEAPRSAFDWGRPYRGRAYAGHISEGSIEIFRRACQLGSFRPTLIGSLQRRGEVTQLQYRVGLMPKTARFMTLWLGGVGMMLLFLVLALQFGAWSTPQERSNLLEGIASACGIGGVGTTFLLLSRLKTPQEAVLLEQAVAEVLAASNDRDAA